MFKFFTWPGTCALASQIALEEAGAAYELAAVDFRQEAQRKPDYLAVNPKGRVPALVTPQGTLTETPAILAYIAQSFPAAALAPSEPFGFARAQEFNSYLCATVHVAHAHKGRGHRWVDDAAAMEAMKRKVPESMTACMLLIEQGMLAGPFVLGAAYSICDAYLYTIATWLEGDSVDTARLPRVMAHRALVQDRPATQRALARVKALAG